MESRTVRQGWSWGVKSVAVKRKKWIEGIRRRRGRRGQGGDSNQREYGIDGQDNILLFTCGY